MNYEGMKVYFENMSKTKSLLYTLWFNRKILSRKDLKDCERERETIRDNVLYTLSQLDKHNVPFIVQNKVLNLAEQGLSFEDYVTNLYLN